MAILILLVMALWVLASSLDMADQIVIAEMEKEGYRSVVLAAMNGDARFFVGTEMFECKGGRL